MSGKYVLCTGGAGYIGSHTVVALLKMGCKVAILDNLANSSLKVLDRLKEITGQEVTFHKMDIFTEPEKVDALFAKEKFDAVIHFAGLKAVGESVAKSLWYYRNNITGTLNLLDSMSRHGCKTIVFSSSATVYQACETPLDESCALGASNPYGQTKFMIEQILQDLYVSDKDWRISILRYFNPVGAHPSGRIGESPVGIPNNLMPFIQQVAVGRRELLSVFGNDYPTEDGTGVRDYIHVDDLAEGHTAALEYITKGAPQCAVHNLGSGKGFSVLQMKDAFEKASGVTIKFEIKDRRPGDLATVVANPAKANKELNWCTKRTIDDVMASAWKWQKENPMGYDDA